MKYLTKIFLICFLCTHGIINATSNPLITDLSKITSYNSANLKTLLDIIKKTDYNSSSYRGENGGTLLSDILKNFYTERRNLKFLGQVSKGSDTFQSLMTQASTLQCLTNFQQLCATVYNDIYTFEMCDFNINSLKNFKKKIEQASYNNPDLRAAAGGPGTDIYNLIMKFYDNRKNKIQPQEVGSSQTNKNAQLKNYLNNLLALLKAASGKKFLNGYASFTGQTKNISDAIVTVTSEITDN